MNKVIDLHPYKAYVRIDYADDGRCKTSMKGNGEQLAGIFYNLGCQLLESELITGRELRRITLGTIVDTKKELSVNHAGSTDSSTQNT